MKQAIPSFVTLASGELRIWVTAEEGPTLILLPGLLRGPLFCAREVAAAFPGRRVVTIELPGLGGSSLTRSFSVAGAVAALTEWLDTFAERVEILASDFAMAVAVDLKKSSSCVAKIGWLRPAEVLGWPDSEDRLRDLALADDGTHLQKLWSHLRRRDMVRPDDDRRSRSNGSYLTAEDLDEALLSFGVDPSAYAEHWNHASRTLRELPADPATHRRCDSLEEAAAFLDGSTSTSAIPCAGTEAARSRVTRDYVQVSRGRVHLRRAGGGQRLLLAFLAGAGSSANLAPLLTGLSNSRLVVAPDYLGQGDSCRQPDPTSVAQLARDADQVASALGFSSYDVYGTHTGAGVAIEAAIAFPDRVGRVIIDGISMQDPAERSEHRERYFPSIVPDLWGTHVHKAWNVRRDGGYFWPWYHPEPAFARSGRAPTLPLLHDRVICTLRSQTTPAYQAIASYAARERLPLLLQPTLFAAGPSDTFIDHLDQARRVARRNVVFQRTPATVWFAGQDAAAVAATLQIYEDFLDAPGTSA